MDNLGPPLAFLTVLLLVVAMYFMNKRMQKVTRQGVDRLRDITLAGITQVIQNATVGSEGGLTGTVDGLAVSYATTMELTRSGRNWIKVAWVHFTVRHGARQVGLGIATAPDRRWPPVRVDDPSLARVLRVHGAPEATVLAALTPAHLAQIRKMASAWHDAPRPNALEIESVDGVLRVSRYGLCQTVEEAADLATWVVAVARSLEQATSGAGAFRGAQRQR